MTVVEPIPQDLKDRLNLAFQQIAMLHAGCPCPTERLGRICLDVDTLLEMHFRPAPRAEVWLDLLAPSRIRIKVEGW